MIEQYSTTTDIGDVTGLIFMIGHLVFGWGLPFGRELDRYNLARSNEGCYDRIASGQFSMLFGYGNSPYGKPT